MPGSPLLVPIHLDALVFNSDTANDGSFARFEMNYTDNLSQFRDLRPEPFHVS